MTRRRLVALVSAAVLFAIGLVAFATGLFVTRTQVGRDRLREWITPLVTNAVKGGKVYIGHLSGSLINGVTIDSIEIRDKRGEIFVATGPVTVQYNWRDIVDNRVLLHRVDVAHPFVHIIQHANGSWNFKEIFPSSNGPKVPKPASERNWGDYVVFDSVTPRNATFLLSMPWEPDPDLKGAVRDSVIRYHLATPDKAVSRVFDGFARTYAWHQGNGMLSHIRLADPDSDKKFGQEFKIASLSVDEFSPTFKFRNLRGTARHLGDTVFVDVPHFDMPKSTGHGAGRVWWGSDLPVRYDMLIHGDSVSLDDVNWVYPDLPHNGGGTLDLAIRNESYTDRDKMRLVDFQLKKMDVRSTKSHLIGDMWFGTGAPVLLVRNVDLRADPVDFTLLDTLAGKPFPEDWQGLLTGTVKARGGPLTHFYVDDARVTFQDAHVRGAVTRATAKGELDILQPAFTVFHGFNVDASQLDLRTIEYLFPAFPKLGGVVSGTATLDSSWLDVRFSNANLYHRDGPGDPTHATGSGRVTYGTKYMTYDMSLDMQPLNLSMVGKSLFPTMPALGLVSGPLRVQGQSPDLALAFSWQGSAGALSFDGRVDMDSVGGYGARGRGQFSGVNFSQLLASAGASLRRGTLSGHYDIDVAGESAAALNGMADVSVERTTFEGVRVYPTRAQLRFADGRLRLADTLRLRTDAATLVATGGIGLPRGRPDTVRFSVDVDSLGGLRPILSPLDTTLLGAAATVPDSMSGAGTATGTLTGTLDSLDLNARVVASDLYWNQNRGQRLAADVIVHDILHRRIGSGSARVDSVTLFGVALDTIGGRLVLTDSMHARFSLGALSRTGPTAVASGLWSRGAGVQTFRFDTAALNVAPSVWRLAAPATVSRDTAGGWRVDSLLLRNQDSGFVALAANVPDSGAAMARLRAQGIPLRDVRTLAQIKDSLSGVLGFSVDAAGTKLRPQINADVHLASVRWAGVGLDSVNAHANYQNERASMTASIVRDGKPTASASANVPADITLLGFKRRSDSLQVSVQAEPTDLSILRPLVGDKLVLSGQVAGGVQVTGTTLAPIYNGSVNFKNASAKIPSLGITLRDINGSLTGGVNAANQDSVNVRMWARTEGRQDSVSLTGWASGLDPSKHRTAFHLALVADSLHAFNKRTVADLTISTRDDRGRLDSLVLSGSINASVLSGPLTIDRGSFFLVDKDLANKRGVSGAFDFVTDTAATAITLGSSAFINELMNNLQIEGVPISLGRDVRLRSADANVLLGGDLTLVKSNSIGAKGLQLQGTLATIGGTYNLNYEGLVQREFQVLSDGTVTFEGPPTTPRLNVRAQYNVPQARDRALGVIVTLSGLMPNPTLSFSSTADYPISQNDLISYLFTGRPGFDIGSQRSDLAALISPTVSAVASEQLRRAFGSFFSTFQFQLGGAGSDVNGNTNFFAPNNLGNYLNSSTVELGRQLTNNVYVSGTLNFCQFSAGNNFGARLEYRFDPKLALQLSYDPPPVTSTCGKVLSIIPQPNQAGFSFLHTWRF